MSFYGANFIFDNKSLDSFEDFVLLSDDSQSDGMISKSNLKTDKAQSSPFFNIISNEDEEPIEFDLYFGRQKDISRYEMSAINKWLKPNDKNYHKLYIEQDDLLGFYFNCIITEIKYESIFNIPNCIKFHVVCDSQYCYSNDKVHNVNITSSPTTFTFINTSDTPLLYPIYEFKCNQAEGSVDIENTTINKAIKFTGLKINEIITIDTLEKTIKSSQDLDTFERVTDNYLKFIKLKQGSHSFTITGNASYFKIKYKIARKFGG